MDALKACKVKAMCGGVYQSSHGHRHLGQRRWEYDMRWSLNHDVCTDCGTTDHKHRGRGLCRACYQRRRRAGTLPTPASPPWSSISPACISCGRTDRKHCVHGLCIVCHRRFYMREYRASDRGAEVIRECRRRWQGKPGNAEKNRRTSRRQREKGYGLAVNVPLGYEAIVHRVFGKRCVACGAEEDLVLDHHHPLQKGHALLHNAVPLCRRCNARKSSTPPATFYDGWKLAEINMLLWETKLEFYRELAGEAA